MAKKYTYNVTEEQQQWRLQQEEEDKQREQCYGEVNQFPNLFAIRRSFQIKHRIQRLLKMQQKEARDDWFQYQLEKVRCQNLIIFLLYLLDRKKEALEHCQRLLPGNETSIITLTNLAVLQWEMGHRDESQKTIRLLQDLRASPEFQYLQAVAVSEKGYVFASFGPAFFLRAIDMFQEAITQSPDGADVYLWKYDLGLAIRRNFNVFAYAEHSRLSAPWLAHRAVELLKDTSTNCPNELYRARSLVELASMLSTLQNFIKVCKEADRREIHQLCQADYMQLLAKALDMLKGKEDSYVLRVCGRHYGWAKKFQTAIGLLRQSRHFRDEPIVNQLLAKTTLNYYKWKRRGGPRDPNTDRASFGRFPGRGRPGSGRGRRGRGTYAPSYQQYASILKTAASIADHYDPEDDDVKQAESFYLRALELDPYNYGAVYDTGLLYQGMGKPEEALGYFQQIVASSDPHIGSLQLVNAYEQASLCLLEMSEQAGGRPEETRQLVARAEEMMKGCVRECRQAVVHLPNIGTKRTRLWESYSRLRWALQKGSNDSGTGYLQRRAGVLDLMNEYLEGLQVCKDASHLDSAGNNRKGELLRLVSSYTSENEAKFIFDLFLSSDERNVITDGTDDVSVKLRQKAVDVYVSSARRALQSRLMRDARLCFQAALLIRGLVRGNHPGNLGSEDEVGVQDPGAEGALEAEQEAVDVCIFDDRATAAAASLEEAERVSAVSTGLDAVIRNLFGMSVSLNGEAAHPSLPRFEGELQLASSAGIVMLVISPGERLSPRMTYIANAALESHEPASHVLPVVVETTGQAATPQPLHHVRPFQEASDLLPLAEDGVDMAAHTDTIIKLFQFILNAATE